MFDVVSAFEELQDQTFTDREFREKVLQMRIKYRREIPVEIEVTDLIFLANCRGWIERINSQIKVNVRHAESS